MKLTTQVKIPESKISIEHKAPLTLIGSCFAESIGKKLEYHKFNICKNPFGIIYNPISLSKSLRRIIDNKIYSENELIHFNEKWLSLDHHGSFSELDKSKCLNNINNSIKLAHNHLKVTNTLIITFGSAWVYEYDSFGIVANCHKIPAKEFTKRLLSVKEIIAAYEQIIESLKNFNPNLNLIFTVSPVRHAKDGLYQNNLSKSTLHLAVNYLIEQHQNCFYFPAYEIVIDELRDYRFYKDDLVHPTELAVDYVWEKFNDCFFDNETQQLNIEIAKIQSALSHKPFNTESEEYQKFTEKTQEQVTQIKVNYPFLDFA